MPINLFGEDRPFEKHVGKEPGHESNYQRFKKQFQYRKSYDNDKKCKFCKHAIHGEYHDKTYWKCKLLGISHSPATDIRASYVCSKFEKE